MYFFCPPATPVQAAKPAWGIVIFRREKAGTTFEFKVYPDATEEEFSAIISAHFAGRDKEVLRQVLLL